MFDIYLITYNYFSATTLNTIFKYELKVANNLAIQRTKFD